MLFEPGRMIVGNAGILLSKVLFVKQGEARRFVVLDAAMNDLIRPAMYDGYHGLKPVLERGADVAMSPADIVGPICESGDTFAKERPMPDLSDGELVAFTIGRRVWCGYGVDLQFAAFGARSPGGWRSLRRNPPTPNLRRNAGRRPDARLAGRTGE